MSQENVVINVHLEKENKKDYLVFEFEEVMKICLNENTNQNELKKIFSQILLLLVKKPVKLEFKDNPEYKTGLYIDVCNEYIEDLNREISVVCKNIPETIKI